MPAKVANTASARLVDFSDRDLLGLLIDAADDGGWASAEDVTNLKGMQWLRDGHSRPVACVATRFVWLWRYGALEREQARDDEGHKLYVAGDKSRPRLTNRWRLTPLGKALVTGTLSKAEQDRLEKLDATKMLVVTRWLGQVATHSPDTARSLITREWRYSTSDRRNGHGRPGGKRAVA